MPVDAAQNSPRSPLDRHSQKEGLERDREIDELLAAPSRLARIERSTPKGRAFREPDRVSTRPWQRAAASDRA